MFDTNTFIHMVRFVLMGIETKTLGLPLTIIVIILGCDGECYILSHRSTLYLSMAMFFLYVVAPLCIVSWLRSIWVMEVWIHTVLFGSHILSHCFHGYAMYWSATMFESFCSEHGYACLGDDIYIYIYVYCHCLFCRFSPSSKSTPS